MEEVVLEMQVKMQMFLEPLMMQAMMTTTMVMEGQALLAGMHGAEMTRK